MQLYHNSRSLQCRSHIGAQPCSSKIAIRFFASLSNLSVTLRTWQGKENFYSMPHIGNGCYEIEIKLPDKPALFWYDFIIADSNGKISYYGNAHDGLGGEGSVYSHKPPSFQITVYDKDYTPPAFLREGTMYQIFPDRFHRTHIPKSDRKDVYLHKNWGDTPLVRPDSRSGDNTAFDFFGGNLKGIEEKLPYLKDLGISIIYLNPIFKARSNHRYDTGDYMQIDPILGTEEDFSSLCDSAEKLGIRIIIDGVFSHTGEDSVYFNRYGNYNSVGAYESKNSYYYSWYAFRKFPDEYACWWNIPTLPEVNKYDPSFQNFIMSEKGVARHWINKGAAGWRLDVADELPMDFLRKLRRAVKQEDENSILLGEVWEDASHKVAYGQIRCYCLGDTLDSVMNYPLRDALINFLIGSWDAVRTVRFIQSLQENYPAPFFYSAMNLMGSHDRARILNVLCEHEYNSIAHADRGKMRLHPETRKLAVSRFTKMLKLITALPGVPCIYYGDEAGLEGAADPFCRGTFPWNNIDSDLHSTVRNYMHMRLSRPVLQTGFLSISASDSDTICINRYLVDGKDAFGNEIDDESYYISVSRDRAQKSALL